MKLPRAARAHMYVCYVREYMCVCARERAHRRGPSKEVCSTRRPFLSLCLTLLSSPSPGRGPCRQTYLWNTRLLCARRVSGFASERNVIHSASPRLPSSYTSLSLSLSFSRLRVYVGRGRDEGAERKIMRNRIIVAITLLRASEPPAHRPPTFAEISRLCIVLIAFCERARRHRAHARE